MTNYEQIFAGGQWVPSSGSGKIAVVNPSTGVTIAHVPEGVAADVDLAVASARAAFAEWSATPLEHRLGILERVRSAIVERSAEIAALVGAEMGSPLMTARAVHIGLALRDIDETIDAARSPEFLEEEFGNALVVREAIGVVGAITPWNGTLHSICLKIAPALASGCTVVLKPSEVAPLNAYLLTDILQQAGIPDGVFNLVSGVGPIVGERLAAHPDVDLITFTGSVGAGRRVAEVAAGTIKRVVLELGGKSANIVLDDADLDQVMPLAVRTCMMNSGQVCVALSRLLVPVELLAEAERRAVELAGAWQVGSPLEESTQIGPLVSLQQQARVLDYIRTGIAEGARLLVGGLDRPDDLSDGAYVMPTVFSGVTPQMTIAREEIFGPVLSIMPYTTEDEAVEIANGTPYGLSGGVWSADTERAVRVARRLRTGNVVVNGAAPSNGTPLGGYKQSGIGREGGRYGLAEYYELKTIARPPAS